MKLIPEWRSAWRFFSVQALAVIGALPLIWMSLPEDLKAQVPSEWVKYIIVIMAVAGIIGRIVQQPGVPGGAGNTP